MKLTVCAVDDIAPNTVRRFELPDRPPIAVYRLDGQFFATEENCTHKWASLAAGHIERGLIVCPWHGGAYDIRSGRAVAPPCVKPLKTFPVSTRDGMVVVSLD